MSARISRSQKLSLFLGNLFEHFDTALYGLLSPFIAPLFFPNQDPVTALILTYGIIPLGMAIKPLGALFFGYLSDAKGRAKALYLSLLGMAITSLCIAFCPTYSQAGILAPICLAIGRLLQSFFASGETIGGAVYLLEGTQEKSHDFYSSLYNASTLGGMLFASAGIALLASLGNVEQTWRLLYLIGALTACFGWILRRGFSHEKNDMTSKPSIKNTLQMAWEHRRTLVTIAIVSGFAYSTYTIALVLMNGFIPLITTITKAEVMQLNTFLIIFDFATLPLFGLIAKRISREKLMLASAGFAAVSAIPLFTMLQGANLISVALIRMVFVLIGVSFFATFHTWSQRLLPANCKCSVISLGYSLGSQLLGSFTPAISLWLFHKTNVASSAAIYWAILGLAAFICIRKSTSSSKVTYVNR